MRNLLPWKSIAIVTLAATSLSTGTLHGREPHDQPSARESGVLQFVDPSIGTEGDHGQLYPGATWPFGLVKLSPDTDGGGHAGYDRENNRFLGFSHTRLGGVGCSGAGGTVMVTPMLSLDRQVLLKRRETATAGYYQVRFINGITAELTVGPRVGYHRYRFPKNCDEVALKFDLTRDYHNSRKPAESSLVIDEDGTLSGHVQGSNVCGKGDYRLYFAIRCSEKLTVVQQDEERSVVVKLSPAKDGTVVVRVALSSIDRKQAIAELSAAPAGDDFDLAHRLASEAWEEILGNCRVEFTDGKNTQLLRLFYTCLYRSLLAPQNVTASNGQYRIATDIDKVFQSKKISPTHQHFSGWSTWDDFRKFPLIGLVAPETYANIARSIVELHRAGEVTTWANGVWPTPSVRNEMMSCIVLDALSKGLLSPEAVRDNYAALTERHHGNHLEQAYSEWVAMRMAELADVENASLEHRKQALSYQDYWVANQVDANGDIRGFFTPEGSAVDINKVSTINTFYYQGNLWHYRWWVPHDVAGLIELDGGPERFVENLNFYFASNEHMAVNEPPLAYSYLFNYAGSPWLTQKWSRHFIQDSVVQIYHNHGKLKKPLRRPVYRAAPKGWMPSMDDDTGAMSAHFVYSALGLYPACLGDSIYLLGSPVFEKVTLSVAEGKEFVIEALGTSRVNRYIQSASLNDQPLDRAWLSHQEIEAGGSLVLKMGPKPNKTWASDPASAPPSMSAAPQKVAAQ